MIHSFPRCLVVMVWQRISITSSKFLNFGNQTLVDILLRTPVWMRNILYQKYVLFRTHPCCLFYTACWYDQTCSLKLVYSTPLEFLNLKRQWDTIVIAKLVKLFRHCSDNLEGCHLGRKCQDLKWRV